MRPILQFALAILAAGVLWAGRDPFAGTWKLDLKKARYSPGEAPAASKLTIDAASVTVESTAKDGHVTRWSYKRAVGNEVNVTGDMPPFTIAERQLDASTIQQEWKMKGQNLGSGRVSVSKNGKVLFYVFRGVDMNGKPMEIHEVFKKVR
jgi:hypothetical protein